MAEVPKLSISDMLILKTEATKQYVQLPGETRMEGSPRPMGPTERQALSWFRASLMLVNAKGGLRPGFLAELQEQLDIPDSDPDADDADWTEAEAKKP